ncbi:hypothetical protein B0F87_10597 [Methylobacter tundripaludum]|uniref:Uncharacterized protein n=2 Tax=Methylobacter tundripaludum TaxID=173365 RepID=A0A2S6HDT7_9GAMM|nr:hypothetical protein B0F87_10597 [Methylobacter tundripaludum]
MVNNVNVSCYNGTPPQTENSNRKIAGGPVYNHEDLAALLKNGEGMLLAWSKKCINDLQKYELTLEDALELIQLALQEGTFLGSEWCIQKPSGPWAACDAYRLYRSEWILHAHKDMRIEYYVKFAIAKTGVLILIASCHPSEDRY